MAIPGCGKRCCSVPWCVLIARSFVRVLYTELLQYDVRLCNDVLSAIREFVMAPAPAPAAPPMVFVCMVCRYIAPDAAALAAHTSQHRVAAAAQQASGRPPAAAPPSQPTVFGCSKCQFKTESYTAAVAHVAYHNAQQFAPAALAAPRPGRPASSGIVPPLPSFVPVSARAPVPASTAYTVPRPAAPPMPMPPAVRPAVTGPPAPPMQPVVRSAARAARPAGRPALRPDLRVMPAVPTPAPTARPVARPAQQPQRVEEAPIEVLDSDEEDARQAPPPSTLRPALMALSNVMLDFTTRAKVQ
jgi:hypothetical protein